jgi:apolipoprotein N-acyltransferase
VLVRSRADSARAARAPAQRAPAAWISILLALAGGLSLALAFPPGGFWPLAAVGPALLVMALWRRGLRGSLGVGLVFGVAFFFPLLSWVVNVAWYAWVTLAVADTVIFAVLAVGQRLLLRLRGWPLAVAGWWVAAESLRDRWPWGGFPWGRLAMSQAASPDVHWVAVAGPSALTFLVALAGGCLAWLVLGPGGCALARRRPRRGAAAPEAAAARQPVPPDQPGQASQAGQADQPGQADRPVAEASGAVDGGVDAGDQDRAGPAGHGPGAAGPDGPGSGRGRGLRSARRRAVPALCLAAVIGLAMAGPLLPVDQGAPGTASAVVAAVQGNVPHARNLPDLLRANTVTTNHADATKALAARVRAGAAPAPDVVIWPENSTDQDPRLNPFIFSSIAQAVDAIGKPVLVGAVLQNPVRNAGQLWRPGVGPVRSYIKRQLVPFGEVIPFRAFLTLFTSLPNLQPVNFTPGHRPVVFHLGKIQLGDVICYEVGFDGLVSSEVAAGANLLTVQTNDADFELDGQTGETLQQLEMARVRAVEHNRSVVVASTTGVSAIIAPDGRLLARTGLWHRAVLEERVPLRTSTTLADRLGGWPEFILTGATMAALAWMIFSVVAERRRRDAS